MNYYYTYQIINKANNKRFFGIITFPEATRVVDNGYDKEFEDMLSDDIFDQSDSLKADLIKYGRENFIIGYIHTHESEATAWIFRQQWITNLVSRKIEMFYNEGEYVDNIRKNPKAKAIVITNKKTKESYKFYNYKECQKFLKLSNYQFEGFLDKFLSRESEVSDTWDIVVKML